MPEDVPAPPVSFSGSLGPFRATDGLPMTVVAALRDAARLPGFGASFVVKHFEELHFEATPAHAIHLAFEERMDVTGAIGGRPVPGEYVLGTGCLLPAGTRSLWRSSGKPMRALSITLDPVALAGWSEGPTQIELCPQDRLGDTVLWTHAQALAQEMQAPGLAGRLAMHGLALSIGAHLLRRYATTAPKPPARGGLAPWQTRRVLEFMADHHAEDIGLADLAALVGLSPFHFARAFRQSVGVPPARHLTALRLERARRLLADPRLSVTAVAPAVGYETPQALARAFRREFGVSPSEFRRAATP